MDKKLSLYNKLVFFAYGYFILLGLLWMLAVFYFGGGFSYYAFTLVVVYVAQAYFRKKLTNLLLGILSLAISIFWSLEFLSLGAITMLSICIISIIMSVILIFSYTKLSFEQ